jgi:hypothetical protein
MYELNDKVDFGKYKGLTIRQIYQGTLQIDKFLFRDYLNQILNSTEFYKWAFFEESEFIDNFDLTNNYILLKGEIHNHEIPQSENNRMTFGNLEKKISNYINQHFQPNFLGILLDIDQLNCINGFPNQIGGDPKYLNWCEKNIESFYLSENCKLELSKLSYVKLIGVNLIYIGQEKYDYGPNLEIIYPVLG